MITPWASGDVRQFLGPASSLWSQVPLVPVPPTHDPAAPLRYALENLLLRTSTCVTGLGKDTDMGRGISVWAAAAAGPAGAMPLNPAATSDQRLSLAGTDVDNKTENEDDTAKESSAGNSPKGPLPHTFAHGPPLRSLSATGAARAAALAARAAAEGWLVDPSHVEIGAELPGGTFGSAYRGRWRGTDVVVKSVRVTNEQELGSFLRELECHEALRSHDSVLPFVGAAVCADAGRFWAVSEYMPGGNLADLLRRHRNAPAWVKGRWPLSQRLQIALEVATALAALQVGPRPILHRDVKPSNVLIDAEGRARLADFGLSRREWAEGEAGMTGETGTYIYMAPEVMRHEQYDGRADVWSFGVMLAELITTQTPYSWAYMTPVQIALAVADGKLWPALPSHVPPRLSALVTACCRPAPDQRSTFDHIVRELASAVEAEQQR
ncbi:hypothetical protein MNEG_6317, partial [Monoraphidium neglectum]